MAIYLLIHLQSVIPKLMIQTRINSTNTTKQRVPTGLTRKQKSPYALQYLQFERRLENNKHKCKLPTLPLRTRKHSMHQKINNEQYLALAKQLKQNKQPLRFCEDKQNDDGGMGEELAEMRNKLGQVKQRYITSQCSQKNKVLSLQYSQQITPHPQQITPHPQGELPLQQLNCYRSRALSNALYPLKQLDQNAPSTIKFLQYKKGKRELPSWMKLE